MGELETDFLKSAVEQAAGKLKWAIGPYMKAPLKLAMREIHEDWTSQAEKVKLGVHKLQGRGLSEDMAFAIVGLPKIARQWHGMMLAIVELAESDDPERAEKLTYMLNFIKRPVDLTLAMVKHFRTTFNEFKE